MTIPDEPAELSRWLEQAIVSGNVHRLASELKVVHGTKSTEAANINAYQQYLPAVEAKGFSALPRESLKRLLSHPQELLSLAEHVLINGGTYWDEQLNSNQMVTNEVAQGWERLQLALPKVQVSKSSKGTIWLGAVLATAAALFVAVFVLNPFGKSNPTENQTAVAWGWQKENAFAPANTKEEYLNQLANSANDWFNKKPEDKAALAKRIGQFREGCSALLVAEHKILPAEDKAWLKERCTLWRDKLDEQLKKLETEPNVDIVAVREATDTIVNNLMTALKKRAGTA